MFGIIQDIVRQANARRSTFLSKGIIDFSTMYNAVAKINFEIIIFLCEFIFFLFFVTNFEMHRSRRPTGAAVRALGGDPETHLEQQLDEAIIGERFHIYVNRWMDNRLFKKFKKAISHDYHRVTHLTLNSTAMSMFIIEDMYEGNCKVVDLKMECREGACWEEILVFGYCPSLLKITILPPPSCIEKPKWFHMTIGLPGGVRNELVMKNMKFTRVFIVLLHNNYFNSPNDSASAKLPRDLLRMVMSFLSLK